MKIDQIRIYAEVLEQGIDFKGYINSKHKSIPCINIYTKKGHKKINKETSLLDKIRALKDVDVLITAISDNCEYPLTMIEYSTAVPTDDHKMQRSDVYFWGAAFKVPVIKISPDLKGLNQNFGGGSKYTNEVEIFVAHKKGALFFPIVWNTIPNTDILQANPNALSCIAPSAEIDGLVDIFISTFILCNSYSDYYSKLDIFYRQKYGKIINDKTVTPLNYIVNSSRFNIQNGKVRVKINRFGHAMDPERGILYYVNMLVGCADTITEIQINRSSLEGRCGYNALFDGLSTKNELLKFIADKYYYSDNVLNESDAIWIFTHSLKLNKYIKEGSTCIKTANGEYQLDNAALTELLENHTSIAAKSIFFLSSELRLTDVNRKTICKIVWDPAIADKYIADLSNSTNYVPTMLEPLNSQNDLEDIVTYASVELYKKLQCNLLAVSYPGAQGDRCILIGEGRSVKRKYIDIIAYESFGENGEAKVFLEECKSVFNKSLQKDTKRLLKIKQEGAHGGELFDGLVLLTGKVAGINNISDVYISVGAKHQTRINYNVDYIFMFDIDSDTNNTIISYSVALINMKLVNKFLALSEDGQSLKGKIILDKIYKIK